MLCTGACRFLQPRGLDDKSDSHCGNRFDTGWCRARSGMRDDDNGVIHARSGVEQQPHDLQFVELQLSEIRWKQWLSQPDDGGSPARPARLPLLLATQDLLEQVNRARVAALAEP